MFPRRSFFVPVFAVALALVAGGPAAWASSPLFESSVAEAHSNFDAFSTEAESLLAYSYDTGSDTGETWIIISASASGCIISGCTHSACLGSACLHSFCLGSGCLGSYCLLSACVESTCWGSICVGTTCVGTACVATTCQGSVCGTSGCGGSLCQTSGCTGSGCAGSSCGGSMCAGTGCGTSVCAGSGCGISVCVATSCTGSLCASNSCNCVASSTTEQDASNFLSLSVEGDVLQVSVPADGVYSVSLPGSEGKSLKLELSKDLVYSVPTRYFQ